MLFSSQLVDNERVLLAPLCTSRAIGSRFVAMRENRITLVVATTKSTPSGNYTGLNILFTGYVSSKCLEILTLSITKEISTVHMQIRHDIQENIDS